jgi:hypothetical protein
MVACWTSSRDIWQELEISAKHLAAYLEDMTYRFINRDNPFLFRDTMMKLVEAPVLE